jgi:hypothetical protein
MLLSLRAKGIAVRVIRTLRSGEIENREKTVGGLTCSSKQDFRRNESGKERLR